jgi:hypothetical protein
VIIAGKVWMKLAISREKAEAPVVRIGAKPAEAPAPTAILTISREFGSGGREIGQAIARDRGYRYVDRELILADIRKDGPKWEQWAAELDEHYPTVWEKYDWSFRGLAALVQLHILEHAQQGGVVIMGRGGNFVLRDVPHAYRIRVTAPMDARIERVIKRESVDRDTAKWLCERTDRERAGYLHALYGRRWDDPGEYDRVFSITGPSVDREAAEVMDALNARPVTSRGLQTLHLLAGAARVRAGIATNPGLFVPVLDVLVEGEGLVLRGITHTPKEHQRIDDEAKRLAGALSIRSELHYRK